MATCNKQHRYLEGFNELPEAQDNRNGGRHICATCAYDVGRILRTFKIKKNVEVTDNGKIII